MNYDIAKLTVPVFMHMFRCYCRIIIAITIQLHFSR